MAFVAALLGVAATISTEPVGFLMQLGRAIKNGAGITEQLLFDKACLYELEYGDEVCANLSSHADENMAVQRVVNDFGRNVQLISNVSAIIVSLFIGAFTDRFGFRAIIMISLVCEY